MFTPLYVYIQHYKHNLFIRMLLCDYTTLFVHVDQPRNKIYIDIQEGLCPNPFHLSLNLIYPALNV